ncbi:ATP-binding protein [Glutamicibacter ardleyensis]|uniref:ATP-binding protein n=1 Tax=Glutamicibacter ardleyensis TaxID=225894 RepID=A0ABQ2D8X6_9MICC|nr:ATP-binding protein [Glutamicibacter ardleyensis]GGJ49945.1 hypothetical protein GCM10007173_05610 [Glutamicibacter ardleyensis]
MPTNQEFGQELWTRETVLPDPSTIAAIGRHHDLKSAIADLVDNSIDADATHVRVRFVQRGSNILALQIIDNGKGMSSVELKKAMTFGAKREYKSADLGYFGLGLKVASLSQADSFAVYSRQEWGQSVGRRMDQSVSSDFSVDVLEEGHASRKLDDVPGLELVHGTLVEWRGLLDVIHTSEIGDLIEWRTSKLRAIREHLGIIFHRRLQERKVCIDIDTYDVDRRKTLPPTLVDPIDPFEDSLERNGYPQDFIVDLPDGTSCKIEAHIFLPRLGSSSFNLYGEPGESSQGVFLYRRGRLLSVGQNWAGLRVPKKDFGLGRIKIELDDSNEHFISLNSEKIAPIYSEDFMSAMSKSHTPEQSARYLDTYFVDLIRLQKESRRTKRKEIRLVEPSRGINPSVISQLESLQYFDDCDPIELRLVTLPSNELFRADRVARRIDLSVEWVRRFYGLERRLNNGDAQLLKVFLYFLLETDFKVEQRWSPQREERHRLMNAVLMEAIAEDFDPSSSTDNGRQ